MVLTGPLQGLCTPCRTILYTRTPCAHTLLFLHDKVDHTLTVEGPNCSPGGGV